MVAVTSLREQVLGPVFTPVDDDFGAEVAGWNTSVIHRPDVVVGASSAADVAEAVKFARGNNLSVAVQSTGHGAETAVNSGVLVTTKRLTALSIDPAGPTATLGAGVRWGQVVLAAAEHGLAPIIGSSATVGAVGYLLGGGLGPLARSHGFSSDYARRFTVVAGTGEVLTVDQGHHSELFWALRGGKSDLGIVTEMQIDLVPLPSLYAGSLAFAEEDIEQALRAWTAYVATAATDVTTSALVVHFPSVPLVPEPLRGRRLLFLRFAYPGDAATGERLAAPLRAAAPVYIDALGQIPASEVASIHNDPPDPSPSWMVGRLLDSIDDDLVDVLLAHVGPGRLTPLLAIEVRHIGAATRRDVAGGSAVGGRGSDFTLTLLGIPDPALFHAVLPAASTALLADLEPWTSAVTNVNFLGRSSAADTSAWPPPMRDRLDAVRRHYDPDRVLASTALA